MRVKPMGMLLMLLAGWINRHRQDVIMISVVKWSPHRSDIEGVVCRYPM
jgi:hypothetical protein